MCVCASFSMSASLSIWVGSSSAPAAVEFLANLRERLPFPHQLRHEVGLFLARATARGLHGFVALEQRAMTHAVPAIADAEQSVKELRRLAGRLVRVAHALPLVLQLVWRDHPRGRDAGARI